MATPSEGGSRRLAGPAGEVAGPGDEDDAGETSTVLVRDATDDDLGAITHLYNALIPTTTVAWRDDEATAEEMAAWFEERQADRDAVLVAEIAGEVVGYACWGSFRGRGRLPGYRHTVELTIHVAARVHGRGVGRTLMDALIEEARRRGIHVLVAAIDAANVGSIDFHRAVGFTEVGRMPEVGRKFDRWLDLVLMQLIVA